MDNCQLIVGNEDCPFKTVVKIVLHSTLIRNDWPKFAIQLDVTSEQIESFRQGILLKTITIEEIIYKVIVNWKAGNGSKATLTTLLQVVEGHCGANDVGELLRLEYKQPCKEAEGNRSIEWKNLSPAFQNRVIETFQHFTPNMKHAEVLPKLTGSALVSLMRGKKPHVLSLPEELSYYISRTIVTRNIISDKIFNQNTSDIFLFIGVDRYELSKLAKHKLTGGSRQQLQGGVNVKFMTLDQENHFERICGKTLHPVHLLNKEDGKFRWMKSTGAIVNLRNYIDQEQDELCEEQFSKICTSTSIPVLICDTPGMGKSVLLAQIGHRLVQLHPERTILFIVLSKFIEYAKSLEIHDNFKMIELTLQNWTEVALQQSKLDLKEETILTELLLDGYDEVDMADRKLALVILRTISKSFQCIRLWITSRPHLMDELENGLNVLGYNIRPFLKENQVHFLSTFWSRNAQLDQEKVKLFAKRCLKFLKARMNSTEHDIAGIPLQCLLIGEVYEDDALEFSKVDDEIGSLSVIEVEIGNITNLYSLLIKKKLEKYKSAYGNAKWSEENLMIIHTHLSLEELFPVEHRILGLTKTSEIDINEVVKGGILTSTRMETVTFLHRTFAEYFVAWFILDKLEQEEEWTPEILNLFFSIVNCSIRFNFFRYKAETKFTHPVICYFLNSMLINIQIDLLPNNIPSKLNDQQLKFVKDITIACIEGNLVQIFKLLDSRGVLDKLSVDFFNLDLLLVSVRSSNVEIVMLVITRFERHHNFDLEVQKATLREAVKQGKFPVLEFLVKAKQLGGIVENFEEGPNLVCNCVEETMDCSDAEIKEKILVLQMLVGINRSLVDGPNGSSTKGPLLSKHAHVRILKELVRLGANVVAQNEYGETVLHLGFPASREDYHNLAMSISPDKLKQIIHLRERVVYQNALMVLMSNLDPLPETLDIFHGVGGDFNSVNEHGDSVLAVAVKCGRNPETIRKLVQLGAVVKRHFRTTNLLHVAVEYGNAEAAGVLLGECKIHVNSMDDNRWTPLDHAIDKIISAPHSGERKTFSELAKILVERGGRLKEFANFKREPLLHVIAANNLEPVKLLVQLGIYEVAECELSSFSLGDRHSIIQRLLANSSNPSALSNRNQTPFHAFLRNKQGHDFNIFQLFKSKWDERSLWTPSIATLALEYAVHENYAFPDKDFESFARECQAHGADFNWKDNEGNSLLHLAVKSGKANTVNFLIKNGVDVNSKNNRGISPIQVAAMSSIQSTCLEVITCLIENRANPMEITDRGENILHLAAMGTADALKYFLELGGADVNGRDSCGDTPLHYEVCHRNESAEIVSIEKCRLLIQYGADGNILNCYGHTPMKRAMKFYSENTPVIEILSHLEGPLPICMLDTNSSQN